MVDLNQIVKPDLCIVDARVGLEGWGGPKTRRLDMFIVGRKPLSVDATMARIMGFEPDQVRHLVEAEEFSSGSLNPKVLGKNPKAVAVKFKPPFNLSPKGICQQMRRERS